MHDGQSAAVDIIVPDATGADGDMVHFCPESSLLHSTPPIADPYTYRTQWRRRSPRRSRLCRQMPTTFPWSSSLQRPEWWGLPRLLNSRGYFANMAYYRASPTCPRVWSGWHKHSVLYSSRLPGVPVVALPHDRSSWRKYASANCS